MTSPADPRAELRAAADELEAVTADLHHDEMPCTDLCRAAAHLIDAGQRVLRDHDAELVGLRAELEAARALIARQLGDCIGCTPDTGPDETCPHDGRSYAEWVAITSEVIGRQNEMLAELAEARRKLEDFTQHGLRADPNPTMDCSSVEALYVAFVAYLKRIDDNVRSRASRPSSPVTENSGEDVRGYSVWLDRHAWGHVIDGLIGERERATKRKQVNSKSTSGHRADEIAAVINRVSFADPLRASENSSEGADRG